MSTGESDADDDDEDDIDKEEHDNEDDHDDEMDDNDDDDDGNDNADDYRVGPTWVLPPGSACPAFSLLALLEDGQATKVFSRESFTADYVVLLFLPVNDTDNRFLCSQELASFRDQVKDSWNSVVR